MTRNNNLIYLAEDIETEPENTLFFERTVTYIASAGQE